MNSLDDATLDARLLRGVQTPRLLVAPTDVVYTSGEDVIDLAAAYGLVLDPWQCSFVIGSLGERADGKWAAPRVGLSVPRQNGKNGALEAIELASLLLFGERLVIHSAHEVKTALEAFRRAKDYFENYDDLRKKVKRITTGSGNEGIELLSGQRLRFMARSRSAGRGFSADRLIMDEAQELAHSTFAAILPAMSARPNPQIILTGTPPGPETNGEVFTLMRTNALAGTDARVYYAEHSADPDLDNDDPLAVAQANPALGIRIAYETTLDERSALSDDDYSRERLGRWDAESKNGVIPLDSWLLLASNEPTDDRTIALAIDAAPDRSTASVGLAGFRGDGKPQVELVQRRNGVAWVVEYVAGLVGRQSVRAVVIDAAGPAASLIEPLRAKGVLVTVTGAQQMKEACGGFYDAALDGTLRHLDDPALNTALAAARKRTLGDAWAWHRKDTTDITPLVAVTLALWGLTSTTVAAQPKTKQAPRISTVMYGFN